MDTASDPRSLKRYTPEEFALADGKEGRPALIVYKGRVYDVTGSKLWRNGVHVKAHQSGNDLTGAMGAAPHDDRVVLDRFQPVGILLEQEALPGMRMAPPLFEFILSKHPHPISVHFPIALALASALFTFIALFLPAGDYRLWFEQAALFNLIIAAVGTPPAAATGLLSWYYNYSSVWTPIYRMKTYLTIALGVLLIIALIVRFSAADATAIGSLWYWVYAVAVMATGPVVVGLGYFGGKITFPS